MRPAPPRRNPHHRAAIRATHAAICAAHIPPRNGASPLRRQPARQPNAGAPPTAALILQTRLKHLGPARAAVAARRPIRMHRCLRNVDHPPAVRAVRMQLMDEVGKRRSGVGCGFRVQGCTSWRADARFIRPPVLLRQHYSLRKSASTPLKFPLGNQSRFIP